MKLATLLFVLAGCGRPAERVDNTATRKLDELAAEPVERSAAPSRPASSAPSIYDLGMSLRAASGQTIGLDAARGSPVLVAMFYASCPVACPVLVQEIGFAIEEAGREDVRVLLVSFDPDRDTPEKLREVVKQRALDARYTVAAAEASDARLLASTLGIKYRKLENGEFYHGATIVLLDEDGRPIARTDTVGERFPIVSALRDHRTVRPASIVRTSDGSASSAEAHAFATSR